MNPIRSCSGNTWTFKRGSDNDQLCGLKGKKTETHKSISAKKLNILMVNTEMAVSSRGSGPSCLTVVHCSTVGVIPAPSRAIACADGICNVKALCTTGCTDRETILNLGLLTRGESNCTVTHRSHAPWWHLSALLCVHVPDNLTHQTVCILELHASQRKQIHIHSETVEIRHPDIWHVVASIFCRISSASSFAPLPSLISPCPSKNTEGCKPSPSNTATPCFCVACSHCQTVLQPQKKPKKPGHAA